MCGRLSESRDLRRILDACMIKLAVLTNILSPYRLPLYERLAVHFRLAIYHGGPERNRREWAGLQLGGGTQVKKSWGVQIPLPKRRNGNSIDTRFIHIAPGILTDLLRFSPDVIISNEMGFRSLIAVVYGFVFRTPVWVWWGGTCHTERRLGVFRRVIRRAFRRWVKHWITYGETSTRYLLTLGVDRSRILQIQNCVDDQLFVPEGPRAFQITPRPVVLYVGQLVKRKGVSHLIRAAATLQHEGLPVSLLIVGSGPEEMTLKRLVQELKARDVHFNGGLAPGQMPAVYRSADLLVLPTLEDVWGLVVNEALLSGIPVLCSKYAGCAQELLPQGAIFDPLDEEEFARVLREVLTSGGAAPVRSRVVPTQTVAEHLITGVRQSCAS